MFIVELIGMIDLTECVPPSNVVVVAIHFGVYLIFHRSLLVKRYIFQVDLVVDWIDLIHHLNLLVLHAKIKILLWICDVIYLLRLDWDSLFFLWVWLRPGSSVLHCQRIIKHTSKNWHLINMYQNMSYQSQNLLFFPHFQYFPVLIKRYSIVVTIKCLEVR